MDRSADWQVCQATDVRCDICEAREQRGDITRETAGEGETERTHREEASQADHEGGQDDGLTRYRRKQMQEQYEMDEYMEGLWQIQGKCMVCRIVRPGFEWDHGLDRCHQQDKW